MRHIKFFAKLLLSYFPTPIPVGMPAFNAWLDSIVELTGPIADAESLKWVVSNEVMRMPSAKDRVPKRAIVKILRKFAANQLAAATVNTIKQRQEELRQAAQAANQAEVTAAPSEAVTDVPKTQDQHT